MAGVNEQKNELQSSELGSVFSGLTSMIPVVGPMISNAMNAKHQKGSDSTPAGTALVGEHGPELVQMPQGAKVYPNIKDGYDMLEYVTRNAQGKTGKENKEVNPPPQMDPTNQEVSNTAMIAALHDKLNKVASAIKRGR
jgi:hypothetical protein